MATISAFLVMVPLKHLKARFQIFFNVTITKRLQKF